MPAAFRPALLAVSLLWPGVCLLSQVPAPDLRAQAVAAFREGRLPEAERALRTLIGKAPRDAGALGFLAIVLDNQARYPEAERYYKEALALEPRNISLLNNFGNHCAAAGDKDGARRQFLRVLALEPGHANANLQLARIAVERKQGREALESLARVPDQTTGVALLHAEALHWAGQTAESDAAFNSLTEASSGDPAALFAIGLALARMERFDRAEQMFSRVLARNPGDADALYNLGLAAARAGHLERARGALETARKTRPGDVAILAKLGRIYATEERYSEAILVLSEARKQSPRNAEILAVLARTLDAGGFFHDAISAYDDYLALNPNDEAARSDRALDYAVTGRLEEGIAEMKGQIARFPKHADGYFRLALITGQRDPAGAVALLNRALTLEPDLVSARNERGMLLHKLSRSADAVKDLEIAATAEPDNPGVLSGLGMVYLALERPKDAEAVLRRAAQLAPEDRGVLMHLGRALSEVGKQEESRVVLARLEALGPEQKAPDRQVSVLGMLGLPPAQRLARVIAALERGIRRKPDDPSLRLQLANALLEAGRREDAAAAVQAIQNPEPAVRLEIARTLYRSSSPGAALSELDRMPEDGRREAFHVLRAELLEAAGRRTEARTEIAAAAGAIERNPDAAWRAAVLQFRWGEYQAAAETAGHAASLEPALLVKAAALDRLGKVNEAAAILGGLESRRPEWGRTFLLHGALLAGRGERGEAGRILAAADALGGGAPDLSRCLSKPGDCSAPAREAVLEAIGTGAH